MTEPRIVVLRNEVDAHHAYHCDALAASIPGALDLDYANGERFAHERDGDPSTEEPEGGGVAPSLDHVDGVVLSGSTAGVYEAETYPWMTEQCALVEELVEREIPTLGVCFGHQLVNDALGGTVEASESIARLVEATFTADPLFEGVSPIVPAVHGDRVLEPGSDLSVIASTEYYDAFATRHDDAPVWTTQCHPEFTAAHRRRLAADYDFRTGVNDFADVNAGRVLTNFTELVAERT